MRTRSNCDVPHRFTGRSVYQLPFGPGRSVRDSWTGAKAAALSGWQLNGIVTLQSGQPYTVALPEELDNSNTGRTSYGFGAGDRPNLVGDPNLPNPDPQHWFDPSAFSMPLTERSATPAAT